MNKELKFLIRVGRNGAILAGLYFISIWATTSNLLFLAHIKPILIFLLTYILTECAKRYNLDIKSQKTFNQSNTLLF